MTVDSEAIFALAEASERRSERAGAAARLDGDRLARRAPPGHALPRPRRRPAALDRRGPRGALLRLDQGRARGRRAVPAPQAAQARGRRGHARRSSRTASVLDEAASSPTADFEESSLPAVRAPHEGAFCLQRLAALGLALARLVEPSVAGHVRAGRGQTLADQELEGRPGALARPRTCGRSAIR